MSSRIPHYALTLAAAHAAGNLPSGDTVMRVEVEHDATCKAMTDGECTCVPRIQIMLPDGIVEIDPPGSVMPRNRA